MASREHERPEKSVLRSLTLPARRTAAGRSKVQAQIEHRGQGAPRPPRAASILAVDLDLRQDAGNDGRVRLVKVDSHQKDLALRLDHQLRRPALFHQGGTALALKLVPDLDLVLRAGINRQRSAGLV